MKTSNVTRANSFKGKSLNFTRIIKMWKYEGISFSKADTFEIFSVVALKPDQLDNQIKLPFT